MHGKILWGLGFLTVGLATLASSCSKRFDGCEASQTCPQSAAGGQGGGGGSGAAGHAGSGASDPVDACNNACADYLVCDPDTKSCVECLGEGDCTSGHCDTTTRTCLECLDNTHCSDPAASRCENGTCVGCTDHDDCAEIDGKGLCDTSAKTCVQCLVDDEEPCGGNSCDPLTKECTNNPIGETGTCLPCRADSECEDGHRCIELQYQGSSHGWYCMLLPPAAGGCVGGSPAPWRVALSARESRSGAPASGYCGINESSTTCEAVRVALSGQVTCSDHSECPEGGRCEFVGEVGTGTDRCTYPCGNSNQCPSEAQDPELASCPGGEGSYCGQ